MTSKERCAAMLLCLPFLFMSTGLYAQMPRERANPGGPVSGIFWAPNVILTPSVYSLPGGNLNVTIMHSFGIFTGGIETLFGLDDAANIRFGVDYGMTDRVSIGIGRSRFDKLYDFRFKAKVLQQTKDDHTPLAVAVTGDVGIMTLENGFDIVDRLNYFASVLVARKVTERISLQIMPMFSHFNTVIIERGRDGTMLEDENNHFAIGIGGRFVLNNKLALLVEYLPVIGERSDGTTNTLSVALNIETGGHVFQLFFSTSQWLTPQHVIARNEDNFFDGDFRFGFNVNRVFAL